MENTQVVTISDTFKGQVGKRDYRLVLKMSSRTKFHPWDDLLCVHVEQRIRDEWRGVPSGWTLRAGTLNTGVIWSEQLWIDGGQNWYVEPSLEVWGSLLYPLFYKDMCEADLIRIKSYDLDIDMKMQVRLQFLNKVNNLYAISNP